MSNELSVGVDLRWSYLIKFPLAKLPEKQEIRFSAFTDEAIAEQRSRERKEGKSFISAGERDGFMSVAIRFTDVTWGEDIYAQIGSHNLAKTEDIPSLTIFSQKIKSSLLFPTSAILGMGVSMWSIYSSTNAGFARVAEKFGSLEQPTAETVQEKLDLLISLTLARRNVDLFPLVSFARGFIVIGVFAALYFLLTISKASFININNYSDRHLGKYGRNYDFIKFGVLAALVVGIVGGVFANKIYDAIKEWF